MGFKNLVILIGNVGKKPELTKVGESQVCKFSLATNETYKNKAGEKINTTEWHNIECWGKLAEIAEKYLDAGSPVAIKGKSKTDGYEKNGEKRFAHKILMDEMEFLNSGKKVDKETDVPF